MLKMGDRVLVWSLQSFYYGGFLKGEPAFVKQDQNGDSVILCLVRNFNGDYKIDESYEVYREQTVKIDKHQWGACKELSKLRKDMLARLRGDD